MNIKPQSVNVKPRATFVLDNQPMLIWDEVPGASSYKFTIKKETSDEPLWVTKLTNRIEVKTEDEFTTAIVYPPEYVSFTVVEGSTYAACAYPKDAPLLEILVPYLLSGETLGGKAIMTAQSTILPIEDFIQKNIEEFDGELTKDGKKNEFAKLLRAILSGVEYNHRRPPWPAYISGAGLQFVKENIPPQS